jgi:hypothetical protein
VVIARECSQGGVPPTSELLKKLEQRSIYAQGYVDDIAILVSKKLDAAMSDKMQGVLNTVRRWGAEASFSVIPAKTSVVAFLRKRNLYLRTLKLWEQKLKVEICVQ